MGFDPLSPVAPAYVNALLLPLGRIKQARFHEFTARIEKESVIRLGDISPDIRHDKATFSPKGFPSGRILYNYTLTPPPSHYLTFSPFEIFREPILVICIADGEEYIQDTRKAGILDDELQQAQRTFPTAALVQLMVFNVSDSSSRHLLSKDALTVPPLSSSKLTTMKTVMCDVSARFLAELSLKAQAIQESTSLETPQVYSTDSIGTSAGPDSFRYSGYGKSALEGQARPTSPADSELSLHSEGTIDDKILKTTSQQQRQSSDSPENRSAETDGIRRGSRHEKLLPSERAKLKLKTRQSIVLGSYYLIAGRWPDAFREFVENTNRTRAFADHRWYAKGLEYVLVVMLLLAWNGMEFTIPQICYPHSEIPQPSKGSASVNAPTIKPAAEMDNHKTLADIALILPGVLDMIHFAHSRASDVRSDPFPQILFSESMIRLSCLYAILYQNGGKVDRQLMETIVIGRRSNSGLKSSLPMQLNQYSRRKASNLLFVAYPSNADISDSGLMDRIIILAEMSSVLSLIGLKRKQAMVMRDMFSIILSRPQLATQAFLWNLQLLLPCNSSASLGTKTPSTQGETITRLLDSLMAIYGIRKFLNSEAQNEDQHGMNDSVSIHSEINASIHGIHLDISSNSFGNTHLKQSILHLSSDICDILENHAHSIAYAARIFRLDNIVKNGLPSRDPRWIQRFATTPFMSVGAQMELVTVLMKRLDQMPVGSIKAGTEYWDKFLLRGIEPQPFSEDRALIPRRKHQPLSHEKLGMQNPFAATNQASIVNSGRVQPPRDAVESFLVVGESTEFLLTLQNPFPFDCALECLSFVTSNGHLEHQPLKFTLKASSFSKVFMQVNPTAPGMIKVHGCRIKIRGCLEQFFLILPSGLNPSKDLKIKSSGLETLPQNDLEIEGSGSETSHLPQAFSLEFHVLASQPLLQVVEFSKQPLNLYAFSGQSVSFSCTVLNNSEDAICDLIHITFQHSEVSLSSNYPEKPQFSWRCISSGEHGVIAPGETCEIEMEFPGIPELSEGVVLIDYARSASEEGEMPDGLYMRQLKIPVKFTVSPSIRAMDFDAIVLQDQDIDQQNKHRAQVQNFMLLVDFQNESLIPIRVYLRAKLMNETRSKDGQQFLSPRSSALVQAGQMARLALSLPRLPSRDDLAGELSETGETGLLASLAQAFWEDTVTGSQGLVDLGHLEPTLQLLRVIRRPELDINIKVSGEPSKSNMAEAVNCAKDQFLTFTVTLNNKSTSNFSCLTRFESRCNGQSSSEQFDPTSYILWTGSLEQKLLIKGQTTLNLSLGATFVSPGDYNVFVSAWQLPTPVSAPKTAVLPSGPDDPRSSPGLKLLGSSSCRLSVSN